MWVIILSNFKFPLLGKDLKETRRDLKKTKAEMQNTEEELQELSAKANAGMSFTDNIWVPFV